MDGSENDIRQDLKEFATYWKDKTGMECAPIGDARSRLIAYLSNSAYGGLQRAKWAVDGWIERCKGGDMWAKTHTSVGWLFPAAYVNNKIDRTVPDYDQVEATITAAPEVANRHKHYKIKKTDEYWHPSLEPAKKEPVFTQEDRRRSYEAMQRPEIRRAFGKAPKEEKKDEDDIQSPF